MKIEKSFFELAFLSEIKRKMEQLEWTPVFGASKYEITRCGKVRNIVSKQVLAQQLTPRGYMRLSLL